MKRNFLKQFTMLITLLLGMYEQKSNAQCMLSPVSLDQRLQQSALVAEGIVLGERSLWDDRRHNIYTIYTLQLTSIFKGSVATGATVEIVTPGGQVGNQLEVVTNTLKTENGSAGIFTLIPANKPVTTGKPLYECYAAVQGFIKYDAVSRTAAGPFEKYQAVEQGLYPLLESKLGRTRTILSPLSWNKVTGGQTTINESSHNHHQHGEDDAQAPNGTEGTMAITGFTPATVTAGTGTTITISGSGFGATQGTSTVQFRNANDGGSTYITPNANQYLSWSDNSITVVVPTQAGTGTIRVVASSTSTSSSSLTVSYNITNFTYAVNSTAYFAKLKNDNSAGGYSYSYFTDFAANTNAVTYFERSKDDWICSSGVNWAINSATTTIDVIANDGVNVVRFDNGSELATGVLGQTTSRYSGCVSGSNYYWHLEEVDMSYDDGANFYYGTGTSFSGQYDFYSVVLHEMGHAHQIGHCISSADLMHWSISTNQVKRTINTNDQSAASYTLTTSAAGTFCSGSSTMLTLGCSAPTVTLTTGATSISETGGTTTVTATLSTRYKSAVIVTLAKSGTSTDVSDYTLSSTTITIPYGSLSGSVTLNSVNDALDETNETVIIDIAGVTNGTESGTQQRTVTITDDDAAPTVTMSAAAASISENTGSTTITITLSAVSGQAVTVNITPGGTAVNGTDYSLSTTSLVIPAGSTTGTITITGINDVVTEGNETIVIDISTIANGTESGTQQVTINLLESTLPVIFSKLDAAANNCKTIIGFTTAYEQNNNYFDIEWSVDGRNWTKLTTLASKGNSSVEQHYTYLHNNPAAGNNYYRVKQVDLNGITSYSQVISMSSDCNTLMVSAFPNPLVNQLTVTGLVTGSQLQLADATGKVVVNTHATQSSLMFSTSNLAKGIYYLTVVSVNGQKQTIKVVK
jgi:hypothetical protein